MMRGLEIGRIQVACRALGIGRAALEDSLRCAQERGSFGKPIWQHQSVGTCLADMATKLEAVRQLVRYAARRYDSGERIDMEAGMAKLFASEVAMEIVLNAVRTNLHVHVTRPPAFRQQWSGWRSYRQAAARKSHYARRIRDHEALLQY